jgi:hypothetical protein
METSAMKWRSSGSNLQSQIQDLCGPDAFSKNLKSIILCLKKSHFEQGKLFGIFGFMEFLGKTIIGRSISLLNRCSDGNERNSGMGLITVGNYPAASPFVKRLPALSEFSLFVRDRNL